MRRDVARHGATLGLDGAKIIKLRKQGVIEVLIAERLGCSPNAVAAAATRYLAEEAAFNAYYARPDCPCPLPPDMDEAGNLKNWP